MAKIAIYCLDTIGESMAGVGIRYWEFAKALSKHHDVTLVIPNNPQDVKEHHRNFRIVSNRFNFLKETEILITQNLTGLMALKAKKNGVKVIVDAYDPIPLEHLEIFKHAPLKLRHIKNRIATEKLAFSLKMADGILCASEKQRDLWIGSLLSLNRLTPNLYDQDTSFRQLIDIVPFGLSNNPPQKTGPGFREKFHMAENDKVLLWGGGIWNWFDPLTLIHAISLLTVKRSDIKLVFMGIKHPNPNVPEMSMVQKAIHLAKELNLLDKYVFFNYGWIPYDERQNNLLDADVGVSIHLNHLETRYSFRTRMLDYIWAQLPILCSDGDIFADIVRSKNLGKVVPFQNPEALAEAIVSIVDHPENSNKMKSNLAAIQNEFHWNKVVEPIDSMVKKLTAQPKRGLKGSDLQKITEFSFVRIFYKIRELLLSTS